MDLDAAEPLPSWVPPGWYQDPLAVGAARYWDGSRWSKRCRDGPPPEPLPGGLQSEARPAATQGEQTEKGQTGNNTGRKRWPWVVGGIVALLIIIGAIGAATESKKPGRAVTPAQSTHRASVPRPSAPRPTEPASEKEARAWIKEHGSDAEGVQANVQVVQIGIAASAKEGSESSVDEVAQAAQTAHDHLNVVRNNFGGDFLNGGVVTKAALKVDEAANGLKNAMGAVVAYTGNQNPATLAHFTSQYTPAREEWNEGVETIWRLAHKANPPNI